MLACFAIGTQAIAAPNAIEKLLVNPQLDGAIVKLTFRNPLQGPPANFSVENPASISFDFPNTINSLGTNYEKVGNAGNLTAIRVLQTGNKTRVVFSLVNLEPIDVVVNGTELFITLRTDVEKSASQTSQKVERFPASSQTGTVHEIQAINFEKGEQGSGRLVMTLTGGNVGVDVRNQGAKIILNVLQTSIPDALRKKMDVLDFATPMSSIEAIPNGDNVRVTIVPNGQWSQVSYQTGNRFVLELLREKSPEASSLPVAGYRGPKLSFQFNNIDLRALLQIMADYSDLNIVMSESVKGTTSLQLHDVPWDQALEIILRNANLGKTLNGDVLWIAPRDEIAVKEQQRLESIAQAKSLEAPQSEIFQINYQSADRIAQLLRSSAGASAMLSSRGAVVAEPRSNKLVVFDVPSQLEKVRGFIREIDVATKQVMVEARVVEASDNFTRNIGSRFGLLDTTPIKVGGWRGYLGGSMNDSLARTKQLSTNPTFQGDGLNSSLRAPGIGGYAPGTFGIGIFSSIGSSTLYMEITALQADGLGRLVSSPRIVTSDGKQAQIKQGIVVPYQERSSSGSATTGFKEAALLLDVKPNITPDGRIRMTLNIKKDTVNTSAPTAGGLALNNRNLTTEVIVENGGTLMIGGIFTVEQVTNTTKIPLLGDIPILGVLFRYNEKRDNKTELLVFITPRIVDEKLSLQ